MTVKTVSSKASIVSRKKGQNAVEKSAYISRTTIKCERDGQTYYPKYSEDLVYSEVMLPEGAPEKLKDRAILWNSIENIEKRKDAQVARTFRISLPNEWSYELATEVMQDYVRRNFTSQGMCCDFAIHDSENKKTHQRNLHCHIMFTMRPLTKEGEWGDKQHFIYKLDKDGNKIKKKNGRYEGHSEQTTDWNSKEKAAEWRKDLADTINATNEKIGNAEIFWDWRSFKERGLDIIPEVHLGAKACALENKGVRTERGDINRRIREMNAKILSAKEDYLSAKSVFDEVLAKPIEIVRKAKNEITEMLEKVSAKWTKLELPVTTSKYLKHITGREKLQEVENAMQWLEKNNISTYAELHDFIQKCEKSFSQTSFLRRDNQSALKRLKELVTLYNEYQPYKQCHDMSKSLSGREKKQYDGKHAEELKQYSLKRQALLDCLSGGEKITPKQWKLELAEIEKVLPELNQKWGSDLINLSMGEVIEHNREKVERSEKTNQKVRENTHTMQEQKKKRIEESL